MPPRPATVKPKYTPDLLKVDLNNRRELLGEGVKSRNTICLFHKYPHLAPPIESLTSCEATSSSLPEVRVSNDFSPLYEDPRDKASPLDERLLFELVKEHLHGPTITPSVLQKVHAYLFQVAIQDRHFRQQCLGGVPHSDALKFCQNLMSEISRLLAPKIEGQKIFRLPVHIAVQKALASIQPCKFYFFVSN